MKIKYLNNIPRKLIASCIILFSTNIVLAEEVEIIEFENNSVELFLGGTHADEEGTDFSIGLAYERRLTEKFGVGGFIEHTKPEIWIFAVPIIFHVTEPWKIFIAPGLEREDSNNEFLVRLGNAYMFDMGSWSLGPELSFDFVDDEVKTIFGLLFETEF